MHSDRTYLKKTSSVKLLKYTKQQSSSIETIVGNSQTTNT